MVLAVASVGVLLRWADREGAALWVKWTAAPWHPEWLLAALGLSVINLWVEQWKWRWTFRGVFAMSAMDAWRGYLMGAAVSLLTPNRWGEYSGRLLAMPRKYWVAGLAGGFLNGAAAAAVVFVWGGMGAFFVPPVVSRWGGRFKAVEEWQWMAAGLVVMTVVVLALMRWMPSLLQWFARQWERTAWMIARLLHRRTAAIVLGLTMVRFAVYSFQLYAFLRAVDVHIPGPAAWGLIPSFFFWQSILPTVSVSEVPVRAVVGAALFVPYAGAEALPAVALATTMLWVVNVGVPGVVGWPLLWAAARRKYAFQNVPS